MRPNGMKSLYMTNFVRRHHVGSQPQTPLRSVSVDLELIPIQLVSDTDIEAATNQWWMPDGSLASPRVFSVVIDKFVQQFFSRKI